jgi:hypothetical protein
MFKWAAGDRPLGSLVSELTPGLDQLVEVPLQDWTKRTGEASVPISMRLSRDAPVRVGEAA